MAGITIPLLGIFTLPVIGLICALITVDGAIGFANSIDKNMGTNTIILAGMVFSLFVNAILTLISALSEKMLINLFSGKWEVSRKRLDLCFYICSHCFCNINYNNEIY